MVSQHSDIKIWKTLSHLSFPIVSSHTCSQSCWWPDHEWHCDYRSSSFSVAVYILFFPVCVLHFVFFCFLIFIFIFPFAHLALMLPGAASSELSPLQTESIDDFLLHHQWHSSLIPYFYLFVVIGIGHHVCWPVKNQQGTNEKKKHLSNSPSVNELDLTEIAVPAN